MRAPACRTSQVGYTAEQTSRTGFVDQPPFGPATGLPMRETVRTESHRFDLRGPRGPRAPGVSSRLDTTTLMGSPTLSIDRYDPGCPRNIQWPAAISPPSLWRFPAPVQVRQREVRQLVEPVGRHGGALEAGRALLGVRLQGGVQRLERPEQPFRLRRREAVGPSAAPNAGSSDGSRPRTPVRGRPSARHRVACLPARTWPLC